MVVSRDSLNAVLARFVGIPCTTYRDARPVYPSQVLVRAPDGGLSADSIVLGDQLRVLSTSRLVRRRGLLSATAMRRVDHALLIALDLPGQA